MFELIRILQAEGSNEIDSRIQFSALLGYVFLLGGVAFFLWAIARRHEDDAQTEVSFSPICLHLPAEFSRRKPRIVVETTRKSWPWSLFYYISHLLSRVAPWRQGEATNPEEAMLHGLILPLEIKQRLETLAVFARCSQIHEPFRHILLHGPKGIEKKLAKRLATAIGIDFALISTNLSNAFVGALEEDVVSDITKLFSWAKSSSRGILLFIDDADNILSERCSPFTCRTVQKIRNIFFHNAGGDFNRIMLVLATRRIEDLDEAIVDLCDEAIYLPLPDSECRKDLILHFFDQQIMKNSHLLSLERNLMTIEILEDTVVATRGFSGQEIRDLITLLFDGLNTVVNTTPTDLEANTHTDFEKAWKIAIETKVRQHENHLASIGEHGLDSFRKFDYVDGDVDFCEVTLV